MNQEDRKEMRKVLCGLESGLYALRLLLPGPVSYWLLTNVISTAAAVLGLSLLVSAGRKGRFAWAAAACLLLGAGVMAYHVYKFSGVLPPPDQADCWMLFDPVFLVGTLLSGALLENLDPEGRLHWGREKKTQK